MNMSKHTSEANLSPEYHGLSAAQVSAFAKSIF
jgi:hypothetical protein